MEINLKRRQKNKFIIFVVILSLLLHAVPNADIVSAEVFTGTVITKNTRAVEDTYQPINVTGFNGDMVAEKGELEYDSSAKYYYYNPINAVNRAIHSSYSERQGKYTYIWEIHQILYSEALSDNDYAKKQGSFFPNNGVITSNYNSAQYKLQPYDDSNVLALTASNKSNTLTFNSSDVASYKKISILAASRITSTVDITINFTTGLSTTYKGKQISGWESKAANAAISGLGRFDTWGWGYTNTSLYDIELELSASDQKRQINSISFNYNGGSFDISSVAKPGNGAYEYKIPTINTPDSDVSIFAVSGIKDNTLSVPDAPQLSAVTNITQESATLNWTAVSNADQYYVDVATDSSFSSDSLVTGYNDVSVTNNYLDLAGLKPETTYYYRVRAKNSAGTSNNSTGNFITLSYTLKITKQPQSVTVEENNIKEKLAVEVETDSKKPLIYTWDINDENNNLVERVVADTSYSIPADLKQGKYSVYCEIYNEDFKTALHTDTVEINVEIIYNIDLSWGNMKFDFGPDNIWDPSTHSYIGENTYSWKKSCIDGVNNKVIISNHSSSPLFMSVRYTPREGVFNKVFNADTSVQGRFYENNEDAVKASECLTDITKRLTFGKTFIEEKVDTDKWTSYSDSKSFDFYFAFSGMPDLDEDDNQGRVSIYEMVGAIQIKFQSVK